VLPGPFALDAKTRKPAVGGGALTFEVTLAELSLKSRSVVSLLAFAATTTVVPPSTRITSDAVSAVSGAISPREQETLEVRSWQEPVAVDAPTYVAPLGKYEGKTGGVGNIRPDVRHSGDVGEVGVERDGVGWG
jgi:hypothetical protein